MDPQNTLQQTQVPVGQPVVPSVTEQAETPKQSKFSWIIIGTIVLIFGIGIGIFLGNATKSTTAQQSVNQNTQQKNGSLPQVSSGTGSSYPTLSLSALPLGDNKYTTSGPQKGYVYVCQVLKGNRGAQESGSWISGTTWTIQGKPSVQGSVSWPNATFSDKVSGNSRILTGNGLPVGMTTGIFPIASSDPAYQYDRNPNSIKAQTLNLTLPVDPTVSATPNCMGGEGGVMTNGVPLFNAFDEEMRDAPAHEIQDSCDGHPQVSGEYHYHSLSRCFKDIKESTVLGFALDGFPITGPVQANGQQLTTDALDECHGITSTITLDGKQVSMYHYVMTEDFPYSVSCFKGKPVSLQVIKTANLGGPGQQGGLSGSQQDQGFLGGPQGKGQMNSGFGQSPMQGQNVPPPRDIMQSY